MTELFTTLPNLTNAEVDEKLESAVVLNMKTERLICCYLSAMRERGAFRDFGFSSIYDYADERFGFSSRKTRYLIYLGRRLDELPQLREALKEGKIGWCKARLIASRATAEDEVMWLDTALSLSVRELTRRIKDGADDLASTVQFWMAHTQRATWENALEICRRVAGTQLPPGEALKLIAGEIIATYAHLLNHDDQEVEDEVEVDVEVEASEDDVEESEADVKGTPIDDRVICPDKENELPTPLKIISYSDASKEVFDRDRWRCQYPGCSARSELHSHHIQFRSRLGSDDPSNRVTICALHPRMIHGEVIGVSGRAPLELDWQLPRLMELALEHRSRNKRFAGELDVGHWPSTRDADDCDVDIEADTELQLVANVCQADEVKEPEPQFLLASAGGLLRESG